MLSVRRYRPGDRQAVWDLHNLALHDAHAHGGNGPWDADLRAIESSYLDGAASSWWVRSTNAPATSNASSLVRKGPLICVNPQELSSAAESRIVTFLRSSDASQHLGSGWSVLGAEAASDLLAGAEVVPEHVQQRTPALRIDVAGFGLDDAR